MLVVSVGGNDIALQPLLLTIVNVLLVARCASLETIRRAQARPPDLYGVCPDCGCIGCGVLGCLSGTCAGWPPGMAYLVDLFGHRVKRYAMRLIGRTRPRQVIVAMIYFLDEQATGSWADMALGMLNYNARPAVLQAAIRRIFELATSRIDLGPGVRVTPLPLFDVLDGSDTADYVERVEPSSQGGRKIARAVWDAILRDRDGGSLLPRRMER